MHRGGFGVIEILIAISIFFVLTVFTISAFRINSKNAVLGEARAKVISEINYARSKTLASDERSSWGIHFEPARIVRFRGTSYSAADPSNVPVALPVGSVIGSINLGGAQDIVFERLTGRTAITGEIIVELSANPSVYTVIIIYGSGIVE